MLGDEIEILRRFYELHRQELYTYALALTRSRECAEDVIQTVFRNLLRRSRLPAELRPYVFRSVRNAALDEKWSQNRSGGIDSIYRTERARANGHDPELGRELQDLLQQLNESERECIVLKVYNGLTFAEIAEVCGVPLNTAASWYRRGIEKMRALMKEDL